MIECASHDQTPGALLARRSSNEPGTTRKRLTRVPSSDSSAGSNVAEAAIETSGIKTAPAPIERMNGSGIRSSAARPIATVMPENSVARPAVAIVVSSACSLLSPRFSSSRKRNTTSIE
jgi:hypothetical protein